MKKLSLSTLLLFLFLLMFGVGRVFAAQSCGTNIDQCTVNLANGATATTNYPTYLDTTLAGSEGPAYTFEQHTITWNGCTPSPTCSGAVSFSYYAQATNSGSYTIKISMTGTGTWDNGAIHYSVTGGYAEVDISGQKSSSAAILD